MWSDLQLLGPAKIQEICRALREIGEEARREFRNGLTQEVGTRLASLILNRFGLDAVSFVGRGRVLAYVGVGSDHHPPGAPVTTELTKRVLRTGEPTVAAGPEEIGCPVEGCPLSSALIVPLRVQGLTPGALKLYLAGPRTFPPEAMEVAMLLADLLSSELELASLEVEVERMSRSELRALRAEISPHFVFNILNVIAAIIPTDPDQARRLTVEFADFLHHALRQHGEFCTLAEELWYVEQYLTFERVRLQDRLEVQQEIAPETLDTILPVLTIQPLVENAILHGIEPKRGKGRVTITSERRGEEDWITVEDDGVGIPREKLDQIFERGVGSGIGIGLFNVNRRLQAIYGDGYGVILTSREGEGTRVTVRIPRRVEPREQPPSPRRR